MSCSTTKIPVLQIHCLKVIKTLGVAALPVTTNAFKLDHISATPLQTTLNYLASQKTVLVLEVQGQTKYWLASKKLPEYLIYKDIYVVDTRDSYELITPVVAPKAASAILKPKDKPVEYLDIPINLDLKRNGKSVFKTAESFSQDEAKRVATAIKYRSRRKSTYV
jgi:hypothetical protein